MNTLRPDGVILHKKPGTRVSLSSTACAWGCAASIADLVSLILAMMTPRTAPIPKSLIGATSREVGSGFGKHRHMLHSPKSLINLLYREWSYYTTLRCWSHREIKK